MCHRTLARDMKSLASSRAPTSGQVSGILLSSVTIPCAALVPVMANDDNTCDTQQAISYMLHAFRAYARA